MENILVVLVDNLSKLIITTTTTTTANSEKLLAEQTASNSQLDIVVKQLATHYKQSTALITNITKPRTTNPH